MSFGRSVILRQMFMGGAALGSAWFFHGSAITPLKLREKELVRQRAELQERLDSAREAIGMVKDSDQKVAEGRSVLNHLLGENSQDSAMVSFPEDVKQHFSRFGLPSAIVRLVTAQDEPKLPGYKKIFWSIGLPIPKTGQIVEGLLLATAELEQQDRYIKVIDFALQPDPVDPSLRAASINIVVLGQK